MIRNQPKKKRRTKTAPGSKKTALVVSGGGAKGAFAVGVLKHLFLKYRETGWFSIAGGTSTGALIAPIAAVMAAPDPMGFQAYQTLEKMYTTVCTLDILEKQSVFELIRRQDALYESDPLNDLLHRTFQPEWFAWLQRSKAPDSYVVYTNYQNGRKIFASPKDEGMTRERFIQAMLASASVPVVMEATIIDGDVCYDGGVRDLVPFGKAIALGADTIVPIFLDPEEFSETRSRFRRMDKILLAREKIRRILSRKEFRALFGPDKRLIRIIDGLRPDEPLTENSLTFDPAKMSRWTDLGENKARAIFEKSPFVKVKRA
jgi:predicted acylesterase/phospholipase RssA